MQGFMMGIKYSNSPFDTHVCWPVELTTTANSDAPLPAHNTAYTAMAALLYKGPGNKFKRKMELETFLKDYSSFLGENSYNSIRKIFKRHQPTDQYVIPSKGPTDNTKKPKRKLGDIVQLSQASTAVARIANLLGINTFEYPNHKDLTTLYFNPPYTQDMVRKYGYESTTVA
jgi:hypothetical protein